MSELKNIYYFCGVETYLIDKTLTSIKESVLCSGGGGGFDDMNYSVYTVSSKGAVDMVKLLSEANTLPAFADKKLVVLKGVDGLKKDDNALLIDYVANPSPSTALVLVSNDTKLPTTKLMKTMEQLSSKVFEAKIFKQLYGQNLKNEINSYMKTLGKTIKPDALNLLLDMAGSYLDEILSELEKLSLYVGSKDVIEKFDVESTSMVIRTDSVFDLADAVGDKNIKKAVKVYDGLKMESGLALLGTFSRQFRILLRVKEAEKFGNDVPAVLNRYRVFRTFHQNYIWRARQFTFADFDFIFKSISETAFNLKLSKSSDDVVMTQFIMELCLGRQRR